MAADDGMIELLVFTCPESDRLMNYSPFCTKAEALLRLARIPYKRTPFTGNPGSLPKGKLPVIKHKGRLVADSFFIGEYLKTLPEYKLDQGLTEEQHADAFAYAKMCEEFLYWSILLERWAVDANWTVLRDLYFAGIPALIRGPITSIIRKSSLKSARGHGMGRHSPDEIIQLGEKALNALAVRLNGRPFLTGSEPVSYDASVYGFLVNILDCPQINPRLHAIMSNLSPLPMFVDRFYSCLVAGNASASSGRN